MSNINSLSNFLTVSQEGSIGNRIDFNLTMKYVNGSTCPSCNYKLDLYPSESSLQNSSSNGLITGNFTPTKVGIYSLKFNITDTNNNSETRKYVYLINSTSGLVNYYFRAAEPTHGQALAWAGKDSGSLLFDKPTSNEYRYCSTWIQFSPDILPDYLFGIYKQINYSIWYQIIATPANWTGVQKYAMYWVDVDHNVSVSATSKSFETFNFSVSWANDYFWSWYFMAIKLTGSTAGHPYIYSNSTAPSYANITYAYSTTPAIKQISNEDIDLLSATMSSNISVYTTLTLEGEGTTNISIQMPNTTQTYNISYDSIDCSSNSNCTLNSQSNGEINLTLTLGSVHTLQVYYDITAPTISFSCSPTSVTTGQTITCSCSATDNVDSAPTVSYTTNPSTSQAGTFITTCTATDVAGNSASSSMGYTVNSAAGGGGGTPRFYTNTFVFDDKEFSEIKEITKELGKKEQIRIKINTQQHYIGIINLSSTYITINISSTPQQATLFVGDEKKFDLSEDDYYDLLIKLNSIENNKANLTIKSIYEKIEKKEKIVEEEEEIEEEKEIEKKAELLMLLVVLIIVIILIIVKYKDKKR